MSKIPLTGKPLRLLVRALSVSVVVCGLVFVDAVRGPGMRLGGRTVEAASQSPAVGRAGDASAVINDYCLTCHNTRLKRGDLVLEGLDLDHVGANVATWEKVVRKLRAGVMPPTGAPRPDRATYHGLIAALERSLDEAAAAAPDPGRPPVHRLNRTEYANAIRDILALEIDGKALLPADNSGYGFDNIADVLTVSPGLLERYILAAKKISRSVVGDPTIVPAVTSYDIPYMTLLQDERLGEDLPFGA